MEKRELVQKQAVESIIAHDYTGVFVIAPRVGKTKIVIDALGDKWNTWNIQITTPRHDINGAWLIEFGKWGQSLIDVGVDNITLPVCFASLKNIPEDLDLLIVDEFQKLSEANRIMIKKKKPKRILLISGTANAYTRGLVEHYLGLNVEFEYTIGQAIEDGIISNFHVYVVKVPMNDKDKEYKVRGLRATERQVYVYYSTLFDQFRLDAKIKVDVVRMKEGIARKRAEYIYTGSTKVQVAKEIANKINERLIVFTTRTKIADKLVPYTYHSKNKKEGNLQRFIDQEINTLGVVQMSDMGITFPRLKHALIHQLQSNSEDSIQKFLRTCNLEDEKDAKVFITVYENTMDETWATNAIEGVPTDKVTWLELEELDELLLKGV